MLTVHLPLLEECSLQVSGRAGPANPSAEQFAAMLCGMPGLTRLMIRFGNIEAAVLAGMKQLGPSCFPALQWIELLEPRSYDSTRTHDVLSVFPALQFRVHAESNLRDSAMLAVRSVTDSHGPQYVSVRLLTAMTSGSRLRGSSAPESAVASRSSDVPGCPSVSPPRTLKPSLITASCSSDAVPILRILGLYISLPKLI